MDIFFLSGLGADKTVFQFLDHSTYQPVFIDWLPPQKKEPLQDYALRLKNAFIPNNAIIIGLSFGGMLATEIAKHFPSTEAILISSAKTKWELPPIFKAGRYLPLHEWTSDALQKWFMLRAKWLFGIGTKETSKIYEEIIYNSNPLFNNWAVNAILRWDNLVVPKNVVHIHGTHDRVLPYKYVRCNYTIKKGGHLMVMEQANIISELIKNIVMNKPISVSTLSSSANRFVYRYQE